MTAKKKRKKLINSVETSNGPLKIAPDWVTQSRGVFDVTDQESTTRSIPPPPPRTAQHLQVSISSEGSGSHIYEDEYWVDEKEVGADLDPGMMDFLSQLFGRDYVNSCIAAHDQPLVDIPVEKNMKCLKFFSRVAGSSRDRKIAWNVVHMTTQATMFVQIDSAAFPEGSRGSFVQLLDYAEEELSCERVFICFPAEHPHREVIVKTFMFLGFLPMKGNHPVVLQRLSAALGSGLMFMGYVIE